MKLFLSVSFSALFVLAGCAQDSPEAPWQASNATGADVVYTNGRIYTAEPQQKWAEAMAIRGDQFVYVGSTNEAAEFIGAETKVVDLNGRFIVPGFHDLHVHPDLLFEPKHTGQLQTSPFGPEELKQALLDFAAKNPGDGWIFGGTWAPEKFAAADVKPSAAYLDSFIADRPIALLDFGRHVVMANTKAMELAGVNRNTFEPEHGYFYRDKDGNPTGTFADGAQSVFFDVLPLGDWQAMRECYRDGADILNKYGFVAARSQHVNTERLQGVQALDRSGELTVRYDMAISWKNDLFFAVPRRAELMAGERHRYRSPRVNANYVKFHLDGTPTSRTAYFLGNYRGTDSRGKLNESPEEMKDLMVQLEREGVTANIHVIGDGAARVALDAIEHARETVDLPKTQRPRHMLAHTNVLHPDDVPRIAELGIAAEFSYTVLRSDRQDVLVYLRDEVTPASAADNMWRIKETLESGGKAVLGSDLVVAPDPNPFMAIEYLINRPEPGKPITVEDALTMLTINGAWAMSREADTGSIKVGKLADFAVLDRNLFEIPTDDISETQVLKTVFEGTVVYEQ